MRYIKSHFLAIAVVSLALGLGVLVFRSMSERQFLQHEGNARYIPMERMPEFVLREPRGIAAPASAPIQMRTQTFAAPYGGYREEGRDRFPRAKGNSVIVVREQPVSTFSIDTDTASYAFVRAALNRNVLPSKDAVRIEELINYFPYDYPAPDAQGQPFRTTVAVVPTPWNAATRLLHIGIQGYRIVPQQKPRANLVFLIDTSGSMDSPDKLPLVQQSLKLLVAALRDEDSVAIVTYAGSVGIALEPTKALDKAKIVRVIDRLTADGSTAGGEGIRQAYELARRNFDRDGINRVILATDGDFNVGITEVGELKGFVERQRDTGIYLSVLGFGMGNYNDELMQALAQNGNGHASYIDNLNEARKALVEESGSLLFPIAKDVKIQVEFNPDRIAEYRLIGYETRLLNREDFNNDQVDAGDIGSGHTVTALYEIIPVGSGGKRVDDLRYGKPPGRQASNGARGDEYAHVKIRYKLPDDDSSRLITSAVTRSQEFRTFDAAPLDTRFAVAVAAFGQLLRGDPYLEQFRYDDALALAQGAKGADPFGYRAEFIELVRTAKTAEGLPAQPE